MKIIKRKTTIEILSFFMFASMGLFALCGIGLIIWGLAFMFMSDGWVVAVPLSLLSAGLFLKLVVEELIKGLEKEGCND